LWARSLATLDLDLDLVLERLAEGRRRGNGCEIEALINRRMARAGMRIAEVPVHACPELPGDNRTHW
jgi:hypothetical protein